MSLQSEKQQAINELIALFAEMRTREQNADQEFAEKLFAIIEKWILKATIKYTTGLVAGSNAVTGTFNGKLE